MSDDENDESSQSVRSHSRAPSINSSDFTINPQYYSINVSDSSIMNTTSSSSESEQASINGTNENNNSQPTFDAVEYLLKSVNSSLSSLELDRSIVIQSQLSGQLNHKSKELMMKINELQVFLKDYKNKITTYENTVIPNIVTDLNKSEKRIQKLNKICKKNYPIEFQKSKDKILNRITDEDDDLYV